MSRLLRPAVRLAFVVSSALVPAAAAAQTTQFPAIRDVAAELACGPAAVEELPAEPVARLGGGPAAGKALFGVGDAVVVRQGTVKGIEPGRQYFVRRIVPGADEGWTAAGVDEFLRGYCTPAGRFAFYECARNIYMDEPYGTDGFWTRMKKLAPESLFVWGRRDTLVPFEFMRHVERALPRSRHLELDCGHVPQLERPDPTHREMRDFL